MEGWWQLMLLHYPSPSGDCDTMQEMWRAAERFYNKGHARAIGVSNFCPSSLACLERWSDARISRLISKYMECPW